MSSVSVYNKIFVDDSANLEIVDESQVFYEKLVCNGVITNSKLIYSIVLSSHSGLSLGEILVCENIVKHYDVIRILSEVYNIPTYSLSPNDKYFIPYMNLQSDYVVNGYMPIVTGSQKKIILIKFLHKNLISKINQYFADYELMLCDVNIFTSLLDSGFRNVNLHNSKFLLKEMCIAASADQFDYKMIVLCCVSFFVLCFFKYGSVAYILSYIVYLLQNCFKFYLFITSVYSMRNSPQSRMMYSVSVTTELPVYTILIPLYREAGRVHGILDFLERMEYHKHMLDVKIIIESDDSLTIRALHMHNLPPYIDLIKVPSSSPRTKPKAMNYALSRSRGQYLCVYDAEDIPDRDQLIVALNMFSKLSAEYACLQAKLVVHNKDKNILTTWFYIEYNIWFNYFISALFILKLPIPLGGTSNHFKVDILRKVGGWDAHNVTEDADLGIRLSRFGYKVAVIDSNTMEESPISLLGWMMQRIRWIKGFIKTMVVYLNQDRIKMSFRERIAIKLFLGFSVYSFLMLPWLIIFSFYDNTIFPKYLFEINLIFSSSFLWLFASVALYVEKKHRVKISLINYIGAILFPIYFLLHSIAAHFALIELATSPFKWNKTEHGVSQ